MREQGGIQRCIGKTSPSELRYDARAEPHPDLGAIRDTQPSQLIGSRNTMAHDVFISHSSKDKPTADAICAALEGDNIRCWIAPRDIVPGANWGESIVNAISVSRLMVVVFSSHANSSAQVMREIERGVHNGLPIVPIRIENVMPSKSLEYFLSVPHWLDALTPPLQSHICKVTRTVRTILATLDSNSDPGTAKLRINEVDKPIRSVPDYPPNAWFDDKLPGLWGRFWRYLTRE